MISRIPLILFLVFCFEFTSAQQDVDYGLVVWSEDRDLTWDDFKGMPLTDTADIYYADIYWESAYSSENHSRMFGVVVPRTYMYTFTSYANPDIQTPELLRYLNVYFDLASYYAYQMNFRTYTWRKSPARQVSFDIIKQALIQEWTLESKRLELETDQGFDPEKIEQWEKEVQTKLMNVPKLQYKKGDYRFGFDLGIGSLIGVRDYDQYLTRSVAGVLGIEFEKSDYVFYLGISGGGQRVKETFRQGTELYELDSEPHILNAFLHGGYNIIDTEKFRITPRIGISVNNINYPEDEGVPSSNSILDFSGGLTADIKLKTAISSRLPGESLSDISFRLGALYFPMKVGSANISHMIITGGISMSLGYMDAFYD